MLNVRDGNITIPYVFFEKENAAEITKFLINTMIYNKLNIITIFNSTLIDSFRKLKIPFLFKKKIKKPYLISKKFDSIEDMNFQDGDGDCAFY